MVIYTIDINKGTVDKKDIERLNRLKKEKNKKFYCIMNKTDSPKTSMGIEKIRQEIDKFGIFDIIIPYSAKNVFEASSRYSIENFLESIKGKIYRKDHFESIIIGEKYKSGKRKVKDRYKLYLGSEEIDDKDIDSIIQRWDLKNILINISTQKQKILQDSFDENEKRYKARAENLLKDILSEIDTYPEKKKNSEFKCHLTKDGQLELTDEGRHLPQEISGLGYGGHWDIKYKTLIIHYNIPLKRELTGHMGGTVKIKLGITEDDQLVFDGQIIDKGPLLQGFLLEKGVW